MTLKLVYLETRYSTNTLNFSFALAKSLYSFFPSVDFRGFKHLVEQQRGKILNLIRSVFLTLLNEFKVTFNGETTIWNYQF